MLMLRSTISNIKVIYNTIKNSSNIFSSNDLSIVYLNLMIPKTLEIITK